jgi:sigma-B regulation protein RsbU (phosphoserine phosphatase)
VTEHQARLEAEHLLSLTHQKLRLARQIQQRLLPSMPPVLPGVDVAAVLYSADDTSGDFYDYVTLRDGSLGIIIADVCGHGIGPALLAVETRAYLRALADASSDAGEILRGLNEFLCGDMAEGFVTLFFAQIDPRSRTLIFCGAGHVGYLFDSDGTCTQLAATNLPLGITSPMAIAACPPRPISSGQMLVLFTDGVSEASNASGEMFGVQRAIESIRAWRNASAEEIVSALIQAVREFAGDKPQTDDITAIIVKVKSLAS